jgi:hypothetical protein
MRRLTLAFVCTTLLLLGVVRCAAEREGRSQAALAVLEQNAHKASLAGRASRVRGDSARRALGASTGNVTRRSARLTAQGDSLRATLDRADSLAAVSDSVPVLRGALVNVAAEARRFVDSTTVLQAAIDTMTVTQAAALVAWDAERAANDTTIAAFRAALVAANRKAECRLIARIRCPSRTTVAVAAALTTALVIAR